MMNNKQLKILLFILPVSILLWFHCSTGPTQVAGGGSDTEVSGKITLENGDPATNTQVLLIPSIYNPYLDTTGQTPYSVMTDNQGGYHFDSVNDGNYNLQAIHTTNKTRLLEPDIVVAGKDVLVGIKPLSPHGTMKLVVPDSVDTINGYVYIQGTTVYKEFAGAMTISGPDYLVYLDSVPAGAMPPVIYSLKNQSNVQNTLTDSAIVLSLDTITIDITDTINKPVWLFLCVVGFSQNLADHFGGLNNIKDSIIRQFNASNSVFNSPDVFDGHFRFRADSFYIIPGAVNDEAIAPPTGYAFRVIYDGLDEGNLISCSFDDLWLCHSYDVNKTGGMFGEQAQNLLNWLFGLMRGGQPLDDVRIPADTNANPLNGQGFDPVASIMTHPQQDGPWDVYNISVFNYYKNTFPTKPSIKLTAFPSSMGVYVESNGGLPVDNATVRLYGIEVDLHSINPNNVLLSGTTNANGEFEFSDNPYLNNAGTRFDYFNLLISTIKGQDTAWAWIPFYDPGNAWFAKQDTVFRKTITMP